MKGIISKRLGVALLVIAGMFFVLAVMMVMAPNNDDGVMKNLVPGLFFGGIFLIPGLVLYRGGRRRLEEARFEQTLTGYIRSLDKFSSEELARKVGMPEMELEQWIARLTNSPELDLVFHRPDRTWFHRGRLAGGDEIFDHCASCGADVGRQLVLAGETVHCVYCNKPLRN